MPERLLYSQREAAALLRMSNRRLASLAAAGEISFIIDGARRKFTVADLDAFAGKLRAATPDPFQDVLGIDIPDILLPSDDINRPFIINTSRLFGRARSGAKLRGKDFQLSAGHVAEMARRAAGRCEVSGIPFSAQKIAGRQPYAPSIDRINSSLGYTPGNCRLVCYCVNVALNQWGDAVLERMATGIVARTHRLRRGRRDENENG